MKVIFDRDTDTLSVIFTDATVAESDEEKPGIILDYDSKGNLVSLEILDASRRGGGVGSTPWERRHPCLLTLVTRAFSSQGASWARQAGKDACAPRICALRK